MGVPAMIGMLMLIGIVVTNAIVLIDLINQYRRQGYGVVEAVVEGGFIAQPLAVVVIGGLITSTLLTLLLVPTLYAMLELRKERRAKKRAAKREAKQEKVLESAGV